MPWPGVLKFAMLLAPALSALAEDSAFLESERVVVAIRYLQPTGESHSHVYLYDGAGKLLRQLTNASDGQDRDPVFSRDGKVIVFRRESRGMNTFWRIALAHNTADQIREVPSWYFATVKEHVAMFEYPPFAPTAGDPADLRIRDYLSRDDVHYVAPDKT